MHVFNEKFYRMLVTFTINAKLMQDILDTNLLEKKGWSKQRIFRFKGTLYELNQTISFLEVLIKIKQDLNVEKYDYFTKIYYKVQNEIVDALL